jgi:hypothetical protein
MAVTVTSASYDVGTDTLVIHGTGFASLQAGDGSLRLDGWDGSEHMPSAVNHANFGGTVGTGLGDTTTITDSQITCVGFNVHVWGSSGVYVLGLMDEHATVEYGWARIDLGGAPTGVTDPWFDHYDNPLTGAAGYIDANGSHPAPLPPARSFVLSGSVGSNDFAVQIDLWPQKTVTDQAGASYSVGIPHLNPLNYPDPGDWGTVLRDTSQLTPDSWYRVTEIADDGSVNRTRYVKVTADTALPGDGSPVGEQPGDVTAGHITVMPYVPQFVAVRDDHDALAEIIDASGGSADFTPEAGKRYSVRDNRGVLLGSVDDAGVFTPVGA